ncbi:MAG: hypothetical protein WCJ37_14025 [Syntrophus sp. (in: bacteria)]
MKNSAAEFIIPIDIFNELYEDATSFVGKIGALNQAMGATEDDEHIVLVGVVEDIARLFTLKLDLIWERAAAKRKEVTA